MSPEAQSPLVDKVNVVAEDSIHRQVICLEILSLLLDGSVILTMRYML